MDPRSTSSSAGAARLASALLRGRQRAIDARRLRVRFARLLGSRRYGDAQLLKVIDIPPAAVPHYQDVRLVDHAGIVPYQGSRDRYLVANSGTVVGGDWDLVRVPMHEAPIYRLLHDRYVLGLPWEEIEVYRDFLVEAEAGRRAWHSTSAAELRDRAAAVDELHATMKSRGYVEDRSMREKLDVVTVSVDRRGDFLFCNTGGHHRFILAALLGIATVPAQVLIRHEDWQRVRDVMRGRADPARREAIEERYASHPDLQDIAVRTGRTEGHA